MNPFNFIFNSFNCPLSAVRRHPQITLKEWSFLERIFTKTKPEERTSAKLVTLNTIHWYCDGPEPTLEAIKYDTRLHQRKSCQPHLFQFLDFLIISLILSVLLYRNGCCQKESNDKVTGYQEGRGWRLGAKGDEPKQPVY